MFIGKIQYLFAVLALPIVLHSEGIHTMTMINVGEMDPDNPIDPVQIPWLSDNLAPQWRMREALVRANEPVPRNANLK